EQSQFFTSKIENFPIIDVIFAIFLILLFFSVVLNKIKPLRLCSGFRLHLHLTEAGSLEQPKGGLLLKPSSRP
ncbi:MAG: hypothetical protein II565_06445, partial [Fibrobacter sp.]|nr:hypothetical protein [Fibrobacter sp.]